MSTLSSANVTDVNLVQKERTHMRLCINMLIFAHNLGNWLIHHLQDNYFPVIGDGYTSTPEDLVCFRYSREKTQ